MIAQIYINNILMQQQDINHQICKNLCFAIAIQFHKFSKKCLQQKSLILKQHRAKIIAKNTPTQLPISTNTPITTNVQNNKPSQIHSDTHSQINSHQHNTNFFETKPQSDQNYQQNLNQIKDSLQNKTNSQSVVSQQKNLVYEQFSSELRPKILAKYPTAPMDQINKVIFQKWSGLQPQKKQAYARKITKKHQMAIRQANQKQEQNMQIQNPVKRQQIYTEPSNQSNRQLSDENRFGNYLQQIKNKDKNQTDKQQHNYQQKSNLQPQNKLNKSDYGEEMQVEPHNDRSEFNGNDQEDNSDSTAKMEQEQDDQQDESNS